MILVFDIGKTHKKASVFDNDLRELWQRQCSIPEIEDEDGYPTEDIGALIRWMEDIIETLARARTYPLTHLQFSAYGASLVHLDREGNRLTPLYNYTKPMPEGLEESFFRDYGPRETFLVDTASPALGFLNAGMQLFWLSRKKPKVFAQIHRTLHLPEYLSYHFTGEFHASLTSIGCHTALWHYGNGDYHPWVHAEGVAEKLAPLCPASRTVARQVGGFTLQVGTGVHDSSAALFSFSAIRKEPFLFLSTGTWTIAFNPFACKSLRSEELVQDCLLFMRPDGGTVKAARLFLGYCLQVRVRDLETRFGGSAEAIFRSTPEVVLAQHVMERDYRCFTFSELGFEDKRAGQLRDLPRESLQEAIYQLTWELASLQGEQLLLAAEGREFPNLYVEGGFAGNLLFLHFLGLRFPGMAIHSLEEYPGPALGAARLILKH